MGHFWQGGWQRDPLRLPVTLTCTRLDARASCIRFDECKTRKTFVNDETYDIDDPDKVDDDAKSELEADAQADANNEKETEQILSKRKLPPIDKAECEKVVQGFLNAQLPPHIRNSEIIKFALMTLIDNGSCGVVSRFSYAW